MKRRDLLKSSGLFSLGVAASGCLSSCSCSKTEQNFEITTQALSKPTPKKTQKNSSRPSNRTDFSYINKSQVPYPSKDYFRFVDGKDFIEESTIETVESSYPERRGFTVCLCDYKIHIKTKIREKFIDEIDFVRVWRQDDSFISKHTLTGSNFSWTAQETQTYIVVAFKRMDSGFEILGKKQYKINSV
jgi:hypothetical protein